VRHRHPWLDLALTARSARYEGIRENRCRSSRVPSRRPRTQLDAKVHRSGRSPDLHSNVASVVNGGATLRLERKVLNRRKIAQPRIKRRKRSPRARVAIAHRVYNTVTLFHKWQSCIFPRTWPRCSFPPHSPSHRNDRSKLAVFASKRQFLIGRYDLRALNFSADIRGNVSSSSRLLLLDEGRSAEPHRVKFRRASFTVSRVCASGDAELIAITDRFFRANLRALWNFQTPEALEDFQFVRAWAFREEEIVGGYFLRVFTRNGLASRSIERERRGASLRRLCIFAASSFITWTRVRVRGARGGLHYRLMTYFYLRSYAHVGKLKGVRSRRSRRASLRVGRTARPRRRHCIAKLSVYPQILGCSLPWLINHELFFIRANDRRRAINVAGIRGRNIRVCLQLVCLQRAKGGSRGTRTRSSSLWPVAEKQTGERIRLAAIRWGRRWSFQRNLGDKHSPRASVGFAPSETWICASPSSAGVIK